MFCFSFSCADLLHGNCLLTKFNFLTKILLAKITSCFEFFYVICSICRRSVLVVFLGVVLFFRYSAALLMLHYSVVFRLFRHCSGVPPVFRSSVFGCFWFYSMPTVHRFRARVQSQLVPPTENVCGKA